MVEGDKPASIPPFCTACGYDLTGAVSPRCPECGQVFVGKEWQQRAAQIQQQIKEIQEAGQWVRTGLWIAGASAVLVFFGLLLPGGCFRTVIRGVAGLAGIVATFLALGLFRVSRLPPWLQNRLTVSRDYTEAAVTILLGVIVLALAILAP